MTEKAIPGANIAAYGLAIAYALNKKTTPVEELIALRDTARGIVAAQGDLIAAVRELETEITKQGGSKAGPPAADERFVVHIEGISLSDALKAEIEQALHAAVMKEVAKIDHGGDLVATPLSQAKLGPSVIGSLFPPPVMGLVAYPPNLR
ncbi:hypothetical protein DW352_20660 [Pseudolabrys taiwanensis]|uniref:DUF1843 domain-containing protein n=1 Tax=Pseudolabrys taiwanensis TaxID=331696 RepID=A0A346A0M7_9HYPH|nr:hypothetical protein [Pseudolabrys taiwanensis]AXK82724.1 hypothetical protein DW352_20660 [Pseudolabrys taiwanensis]